MSQGVCEALHLEVFNLLFKCQYDTFPVTVNVSVVCININDLQFILATGLRIMPRSDNLTGVGGGKGRVSQSLILPSRDSVTQVTGY